MENYISLLIATLENLGQLTEKEAEKLDKKLRSTTIPGTYKEARLVIKELLAEVRK